MRKRSGTPQLSLDLGGRAPAPRKEEPVVQGAPSPPSAGAPAAGAAPPPRASAPRVRPIAALDAAFEADLVANPSVYPMLVYLVRQRVERRAPRVGIQTIWELARAVLTLYGLPAPLVDPTRSRYARRIMAMEPDLAGYFEIRGIFGETRARPRARAAWARPIAEETPKGGGP